LSEIERLQFQGLFDIEEAIFQIEISNFD